MNKYIVKTNDPVVNEVIEMLDTRSIIGVAKYNTTLEENDKDDFLNHLLEELLDGSNYIMKLKRSMDMLRRGEPTPEEFFNKKYKDVSDNVFSDMPRFSQDDMINFAKSYRNVCK